MSSSDDNNYAEPSFLKESNSNTSNNSLKTLALQRLKLDMEQISITQRLDENITSLQTELNHLQRLWESSSSKTPECWSAQFQIPVADLQLRMSKLLAEKSAMYSQVRQKQSVLDECIEKLDAARVEEMRKLLDKVKIIQIHYSDGQRKKSRRIHAVKFFSELYEQVQSMFIEDKLVELCTPQGDVIGSQEELFFAYQFAKEEILHVEVELKKKNPSPPPARRSAEKKRRDPCLSEGEISEDEDNFPVVRHAGIWTISEMIRFEEGVKRFGWGNWSDIANYIQTRDRKQVFKFSLTEAGQKSNRIPSVVHAYVDLAKGMSLVAEHLGNQQESEARNRKRSKPNNLEKEQETDLSSSSSSSDDDNKV